MPIDNTRIRAICFDVDGTLSDTDDQFVQKLAKMLNPGRYFFRGRDPRPIARKMVMKTEGPGNFLYGLADLLGLDEKIVSIGDQLYEKGVGDTPEPYMLVSGVREMLAELRKHYPLSIVSARGQRATLRFLFQFELLPFFTAIATGQTCRHTKPYPDPILWAAEKMGVPASECLMIGDTHVDIQAGKRAGAQTVGVLCGFGEEKELRRNGADLILKNTADLVDFLQIGTKLTP
jgi:phosphoglycolate phosphatase-like HAD superfamily hydrolase